MCRSQFNVATRNLNRHTEMIRTYIKVFLVPFLFLILKIICGVTCHFLFQWVMPILHVQIVMKMQAKINEQQQQKAEQCAKVIITCHRTFST